MTPQAKPHDIALGLFRTAVQAAHPEATLPPFLPPVPRGRLIVIAAGKGASAMAQAAERHYADQGAADRIEGIMVTRPGYALPMQFLKPMEAGHPTPNEGSAGAARSALDLAASAGPEDLVLVLLSGGASALLCAPLPGLSLADKQAVTRALLRCGAPISEINVVRKHLSAIKGGRLAAACGAPLLTLAISDVPGDDPATIGSGPTISDPTTLEEARAIVARRGLTLDGAIAACLSDSASETPKPGDSRLSRARFEMIATPQGALELAAKEARAAGYEPILLGSALEGEARDVARDHAAQALALRAEGRKAALLSGGELTVTVNGTGRGGPNQEYALSLAIALAGEEGICALAADTDGTDGGGGDASDPAGARIDPSTLSRAQACGLDAATFLANNDSTGFFAALEDLISTGPTHTNVNDFRAILIDPEAEGRRSNS